jgi:tRNA1(Val) A37 N6-methylase TrmN6
MIAYLATKCATQMEMQFCDAVTFDYSKIQYDTVFSSPPYYKLEKYPHNNIYASKEEMNDKFYKPLFINTYNNLQDGGYYIINICKEVYENVLKELLGEPTEIFPLKKSKRQNDKFLFQKERFLKHFLFVY